MPTTDGDGFLSVSFLSAENAELRGYDSGIVLSNLSRLLPRRVRMGEAVLAELWELAGAALADAGGDPDILRSILLALQAEGGQDAPPELLSALLPADRELLLRALPAVTLFERLVLYRFLDEQEPAGRLSLLPLREVAPSARNRIAYMSGSLADKAYLRFSSLLSDARATDVHSFVDACEEVYNGLCQFCILPLESAEEGRLTAFSRLIIRYGLQTVAVCDVNRHGSGGRHTRFALLCMGDGEMVFRSGQGFPRPQVLELLHTSRTQPSVTDVLCAAEFCGLSLLRADSLSATDAVMVAQGREADVEGYSQTDSLPILLSFSLCPPDGQPEEAALSVFLRWLSLEAEDDIPTGCYGQLKNT